ncbi:hypothetical protein K437DRAFT_245899 [Tilletiaria anomala UBC 951]|uniref:Xanthine dehydrogenase n=1 Tax=Tilletiaria anomala (strain ATCC 24038 / CBS 436.72 / UBC 951) TaxID=1037660 RepID=A0A066W208_TILAU|nr:uncharacterized protein K437DRAFT_245899 [Tilletiaria anomala UBC 951]KDN47751.1 hypothetical protein K437DRAFT_245899 [Tilletiaria anomala UBC 951]
MAASIFDADKPLPLPPSFPTVTGTHGHGGAPLCFVLNRKKITLRPGCFNPDLTLLEYLRIYAGLTGTKLGCAEGGCGACTVVLGKVAPVPRDAAGAQKYEYKAVNACLLPMVAVHGAHVLTVEGIGTSSDPHPVQERIAKMFGSQCGFCTPGIVMSLYATIRTAHSTGKGLTEAQIEHSLDGNLCRCTGYRPILDAAKTFAFVPAVNYGSTGPISNSESGSSRSDSDDLDATRSKSSGASALPSASTDITTYETEQEKEQADLIRQATGVANAGMCGKGKDCCRVNGNNTKGHYPAAPPGGCTLTPSSSPATITALAAGEQVSLKEYRYADEIIFPPHLLKAGTSFDAEDLAFPSMASADNSDDDEEDGAKKAEPERRTLWLRPGSLASLKDVMSFYAQLGRASAGAKATQPVAKLRSGNTETGIEVKFKHALWNINVFVSDHLRELAGFDAVVARAGSMTHAGAADMKIGANLSLQALIAALKAANAAPAAPDASDGYAKQVRDAALANLKYFAGTQIRNVATLGGNIATASPISDLNPVWVATNAVVAWVHPTSGGASTESSCSMRDFFQGYRTTALPPHAILTSLAVPLDGPARTAPQPGEQRFVRAFKQAKRKDDDIAIVNAGLYVALSPAPQRTVLDICLAYGGMAPTTAVAKHAGAFLLGRKWGDEKVLREAMAVMAEKDFALPYAVPGGMPAYRKALALGFLARFWSDVCAELELPGFGSAAAAAAEDALALQELPGSEPQREGVVTTGSQDLEGVDLAAPATKAVGKALPHLAALKQVTGEAVYVDDIPPVANEAYGALVVSQKAHARIVRIITAPAMQIPGVVAVVTKEDIPPNGSNIWCPPTMDEPFFVGPGEEVQSVAQIIAVVVAEDKRTAQRAARAVMIEYDELPHILTIDEAIAAGSYFKPRPVLRRGDVENADWGDCERTLEGETRLGGQEHFYLETNACLVVPGREDGEMDVYASTQNPSETQAFCASLLGVPSNRVTCHTKRLGGGFGGKESRTVPIAATMCLAARKTGRAIRCMLDRDEDMWWSGQRHPFKATWRVGLTSDGRLQRLEATVYCNGGWSQDLSQAVLERAMTHIDNCCLIPKLKVQGFICKTNTMSNTAFRGFGGPQGMFISQDYLTKAATSLGMRTEDLIEKNMYREGERTHYGQELVDWNVPALWSELKITSEYDKRRAAVDAFNKQNRWKKRGLSLMCTKFGISFTAIFLNQAYALIHIYHSDGSILLSHGGTEMGQGLHTKMAQVAATELQVPIEKVHIVETNTQHLGNTSATAASASSDLNGMAIKNACEQLNERLAPFRKFENGKAAVPWEKACHDAYFARVPLSAVGHYKTPDIGYNWQTGEGKPFFYFTQGAAVSEVEVDLLTGDHVIRRADIHMDIGRSINPGIDVGQIEGAFTQGYGLVTTEESLWLPSGRPFNNGPGNLKIPAFLNTPQDMRVSFLKGQSRKLHNLRTIQSSKGVGEPPLFLGCTVFFALRDAIASARKDAGQPDDFQFIAPATPERIRTACADEIMKIAEKGTERRNESDKAFFVNIS